MEHKILLATDILWVYSSEKVDLQKETFIYTFMMKIDFVKFLKPKKVLKVYINHETNSEMDIWEAHNHWQKPSLPKFKKLPKEYRTFQNESLVEKVPSNLINVSLECINSFSFSRNSYYGYKGYFLSLLISIEGNIWDIWGERAR